MGTQSDIRTYRRGIMDKGRITEALKVIQEELNSEELDTDLAVYQIYCTMNCFISNEIKRIIKEEGEVTSEHSEIKPLLKFFDYILPVMKKYCSKIKEEGKNERNN